ncbi:hypothetical protein ACFWPH_32405 [Nocardia sp. NPDC058499]|uniref:hypothetical protein n=1 Tax=Nocardia sp. NPDC058499 TaxID=3346530 RepID=UPI0036611E12
MVDKLVRSHRADEAGRGIVYQLEEVVWFVDLVREAVQLGKILIVVGEQDVDPGMECGAVHVGIAHVRVGDRLIDGVSGYAPCAEGAFQSAPNASDLSVRESWVLLPQVVVELDHDVVCPLDLEHVV